MRKRIVVVGMLAVALAGGPSMASASTDGDEQVVVDGRTFGPEDGLEVETGSFVIDDADQDERSVLAPRFSQYWGSSYVSSVESIEVRYQGEAYAGANVYQGERMIQVCFQYRRAGSDLTPWVCSDASSSTGSWRSGPVVNRTVTDSLDPNAPPTTFHYKTARIDPGIS